ncbi:MAG: hypothetical protein JNM22_00555 [Saprospiraceae bacterium]|nr:hypothetical protein [Saprospiraceae bacterium]
MPTLFKKHTLLFLFIGCSLAASAQIGDLKNKAKNLGKDKNKEETKTEQPAARSTSANPVETPVAVPTQPDQPPTSKKPTQQPRSASSDKSVPPSDIELDFESQPFQPAITWASLLNQSNWYYNITNGEFYVNNLEAIFLPQKTKSGASVGYASYSNPTPILRLEVIDVATGAIKGTLHYEAKPYILPLYNVVQLTGRNYAFSVNLKEGQYELRFWAGTKVFYTYQFSVEKKNNPDPYAPVHDLYFLKGPWENWGRVEYGPDKDFIFSFYYTDVNTAITNQANWDLVKPYDFMIKLYRDGKMAGAYRIQNVGNGMEPGNIQVRNGKWGRFDATLYAYPVVATGTGAGSKKFLKKEDLKDGNYTLDVLLKDKDGKESTLQYTFVVKGGAILPSEKADRNVHKDPLTYLEQGPDYFYVKRVK